MSLTVGFDLDMTLINARAGMRAVMDALAAESGLALDGQWFADHLGPPLAAMFAGFGIEKARIPELMARFRQLYPTMVIPSTVAMPGAVEALAAVREFGGRVLVVTGKYELNARRHIDALGWQVDHLAGELWSAAKGTVLRAQNASIYVGDHVGDITGGLAADAVPIGVATGPCSGEDLLAAGAETVLTDLTEFPGWLADNADRFAEPMAG